MIFGFFNLFKNFLFIDLIYKNSSYLQDLNGYFDFDINFEIKKNILEKIYINTSSFDGYINFFN